MHIWGNAGQTGTLGYKHDMQCSRNNYGTRKIKLMKISAFDICEVLIQYKTKLH